MPIVVNLDVMLARRKMRSRELAERIGASSRHMFFIKQVAYLAMAAGLMVALWRMRDRIRKSLVSIRRFPF